MNLLKVGAFALVGMVLLNSCGPAKTEEEIEKEAQEMTDEIMGTDSKSEAPIDVPEMDAMMAGIADAYGDAAIYAEIDPYLASEDVKEGMGYMMFEDESSFEVTKHRGQRFTVRIGGDENNEIDIFWEEGKIVKITINMEIE
ncbi:MAG: hypothetical protein ACJASQ_001481 [Crocinitomicaceae bacterium]|jgi:hypothetical protein